jgi:hypothetical protein
MSHAARGRRPTTNETDALPSNADLGRAIRRIRKSRCISIEALAFAADLHPTYLSGIECGIGNPTWRGRSGCPSQPSALRPSARPMPGPHTSASSASPTLGLNSADPPDSHIGHLCDAPAHSNSSALIPV